MNLIDYHKKQLERLNNEHSQEFNSEARLSIECEILKIEKVIVHMESENRGFWGGVLIGGSAGILFGAFLASTFSSWRL
jgi:hypothetical protein